VCFFQFLGGKFAYYYCARGNQFASLRPCWVASFFDGPRRSSCLETRRSVGAKITCTSTCPFDFELSRSSSASLIANTQDRCIPSTPRACRKSTPGVGRPGAGVWSARPAPLAQTPNQQTFALIVRILPLSLAGVDDRNTPRTPPHPQAAVFSK